jgi:hypothetical protein
VVALRLQGRGTDRITRKWPTLPDRLVQTIMARQHLSPRRWGLITRSWVCEFVGFMRHFRHAPLSGRAIDLPSGGHRDRL